MLSLKKSYWHLRVDCAMAEDIVTMHDCMPKLRQFGVNKKGKVSNDSAGTCWSWTRLITLGNARPMMRRLHSIVANGIHCKNRWNGYFEVASHVNVLRSMECRVRRVVVSHNSKLSHFRYIDSPTTTLTWKECGCTSFHPVTPKKEKKEHQRWKNIKFMRINHIMAFIVGDTSKQNIGLVKMYHLCLTNDLIRFSNPSWPTDSRFVVMNSIINIHLFGDKQWQKSMNPFHFHSGWLQYHKLRQIIVQSDGIGFRMALGISSLQSSTNSITNSDLFQTMNTYKTLPIVFETDQFKSQVFRMIHHHSDHRPEWECCNRIDPVIGISPVQFPLILQYNRCWQLALESGLSPVQMSHHTWWTSLAMVTSVIYVVLQKYEYQPPIDAR
jgi:hypothetical protein